ncbi:MAG: DUF4139 domain-containing protein [Flammeovirgaceae bacterium]
MKKSLLIALFLFTSSITWADPKSVTSTVKEVTVFLKGAQVTRKATTTISSGNSELVFTDLPASIDPQSLQFKSEGKFKVLSVEHKLDYFTGEVPESEVSKLREEVKKLRLKHRRQNELLDVYKKEEELILANKKLGSQQTGVQLSELRATADFYRERLTDLKVKALDITIVLEEITAEINKYEQQIRSLNSPEKKSTSQVKVVISSKVNTSGKFTISYWVANAGWKPSYDLRVESIKQPLNLVYKANVHQNTGEDWKSVKLKLSSGNPVEGGTAPELNTWFLNVEPKVYTQTQGRISGYSNYQNYAKNYDYTRMKTVTGVLMDEAGNALPRATVLLKGTTSGTVTNIDGRYSLNVPANAVLVFGYVGYNSVETLVGSQSYISVRLQPDVVLEEVVVTGVGGKKPIRKEKQVPDVKPILAIKEVKQTNVEFTIDELYTLLSDGQKKMVEMSEHELPADYSYYCVPKLDLDAFLTARVSGWEEHNLLDGEANLFFEGAYLGKTQLDLENTNDTLDISLGRDKSIIVTRTKLKDYGQKQTIGGNQKETRSWEIAVRNTKRQEVKLKLVDQFPISTAKAIEVEQVDKSGGKVNETTGEVVWDLKLKATTTVKKQLKYWVKYSKKDVVILE